MEPMIGCCGLICSDCAAYVATQANDQTALEKVAAQWREEYHAPQITVVSVICDGCIEDGRKCAHCAECEIRACARTLGLPNCGHCPEYPCEKAMGFFAMVPAAKAVLDDVRTGLAM